VNRRLPPAARGRLIETEVFDVSELPEESTKRRRLRLLVRCCALAAAVILVLPVLPWPWTAMVVPALSPYVMLGSAIVARSLGVAALVGLPVLLVVLVWPRWFCRYACPVGLVAEQVGKLNPWGKGICRKLPPVGRWIALVTLGGAIFGYPLVLWLDPLAIFNGLFTLWQEPLSPAGQVSAAALGVVLAVSLLVPGAWCMRICPLGATQELLAWPRRVLRRKKREASGADEPPESPPGKLARRSLLSAGMGVVCAGLGARLATGDWIRSPGTGPRPIRPPGAVDEGQFTGLCIRCGSCLRACPAGIIRADPGSHTVAGLLTPLVRFEDDYCRKDCHRCTQVCPSGAITRLSLEEKSRTPIGLAKVDMELCLLADDRECDICVRECPYEAVKVEWSEETYAATPRVDPEKCPGCGACEVACPGTNTWERRASQEPVPLRKAIAVFPRGSAQARMLVLREISPREQDPTDLH